jgi:uncharacterized protein YegJ (DUF2314 family)
MTRDYLRGRTRVLALSLALVACGSHRIGGQQGKKAPSAPTGRIYNISGGDAEMNAAIQRARATTAVLMARLRRPPPTQRYLGVKVRLGNVDLGEHIWLYDVRLDGERIAGRLLDDAQRFPRFRRGDVVRVLPSEISDWMVVDGGRACGGFTSRVLFRRMSATEQREYLREMEIPRLPSADRVCDVEGER